MTINSIQVANSRMTEGCSVSFTSVTVLNLGDFLKVNIAEKNHYFEVYDMYADHMGPIKYKAREVGYGGLIKNKKDFNIRSVLYLTLELIEDPKLIADIHKWSSYC